MVRVMPAEIDSPSCTLLYGDSSNAASLEDHRLWMFSSVGLLTLITSVAVEFKSRKYDWFYRVLVLLLAVL